MPLPFQGSTVERPGRISGRHNQVTLTLPGGETWQTPFHNCPASWIRRWRRLAPPSLEWSPHADCPRAASSGRPKASSSPPITSWSVTTTFWLGWPTVRRSPPHSSAVNRPTDLAVLRAEAPGPTPPSWSDTDSLRVGHLVLALGRPGRTVLARLGIVGGLVESWRTPAGGRLDH
jgi:hypothetical protein